MLAMRRSDADMVTEDEWLWTRKNAYRFKESKLYGGWILSLSPESRMHPVQAHKKPHNDMLDIPDLAALSLKEEKELEDLRTSHVRDTHSPYANTNSDGPASIAASAGARGLHEPAHSGFPPFGGSYGASGGLGSDSDEGPPENAGNLLAGVLFCMCA